METWSLLMILLDIIPVDKDNQEIYPYSEIDIDSEKKILPW